MSLNYHFPFYLFFTGNVEVLSTITTQTDAKIQHTHTKMVNRAVPIHTTHSHQNKDTVMFELLQIT